MTTHEEQALDDKIAEVEVKLKLLETLRGQVEALGRRGNRENAFMAGRRSMAYELRVSGGLGSAQLGQEILFLLPDEFVEFYGDLFHKALRVGDQAKSGAGSDGTLGGAQKAKGHSGTVLGSDTRLQSAGTGKRWKNTPMAVANEAMLAIKDGVDKELRRLTSEASSAVSASLGLERSLRDQVGPPSDPPSPRQCRNTKCRSFLKGSWEFCPLCGTRSKGNITVSTRPDPD